MEEIKLTAILHSIRTEVSGGWRITFDVPESDNEKIMRLSELRNAALNLKVEMEDAFRL